MDDSTKRFSSRVENYARYRPGYPPAVVELLKTECGLTTAAVVADVGSGTGFLAALFLANGNPVYGIEPNREMREAGERLLQSWPRFTGVAAAAEATSLPDRSVDFLVAGQAFHWFDRVRFGAEARRILRPGGWVVLIWNERKTDSSAFLAGYEQLLATFGTDYQQVNHKNVDLPVLREFFGAEPRRKTFPNKQEFDFAGLKGRLLSSSYAPEAGQPDHAEMIQALEGLFERCQENGRVTFEYETVVYYGRLG